jgi:hypothetical protein
MHRQNPFDDVGCRSAARGGHDPSMMGSGPAICLFSCRRSAEQQHEAKENNVFLEIYILSDIFCKYTRAYPLLSIH